MREANQVERLVYSRSQAAKALGISLSTLRRLLPYIETIEMPWGTLLIPVDELDESPPSDDAQHDHDSNRRRVAANRPSRPRF